MSSVDRPARGDGPERDGKMFERCALLLLGDTHVHGGGLAALHISRRGCRFLLPKGRLSVRGEMTLRLDGRRSIVFLMMRLPLSSVDRVSVCRATPRGYRFSTIRSRSYPRPIHPRTLQPKRAFFAQPVGNICQRRVGLLRRNCSSPNSIDGAALS
jgi:hypothetical protein